MRKSKKCQEIIIIKVKIVVTFERKKEGMGCDRKGALIEADRGGWPSSFLDFIGGERHVDHRIIY